MLISIWFNTSNVRCGKSNIITLVAWLGLSFQTLAQQYDKVWALGSPVSTMTFAQDTIILNQLQDTTTPSFNTIGCISDSSGNFLFYSNGLAVYNRYGRIMPNGDSLNYPSSFYYQEVPQGGAANQSILVLPSQIDTSIYFIFHDINTDTSITGGGYEPTHFYFSIVNMNADSGRGDVIIKNHSILQGIALSGSRLAACKHANGRDWWIIKPAWHENIYYKFLLTSDSVLGPFMQQIGPMYGYYNERAAYSLFSPDGTKYASVTSESKVVIMDFDRCTGLFSNPDSLVNNNSGDPINNPISGGGSMAFSPSGRFLYVDNPIELNQYDLWSPQMHDSVRIKTDTAENYQMNILQLAPNGNIYISCWDGGSYAIHLIDQPDSLGTACGFHLLGQPVLSQSPLALPYFPNYHLGTLIGSGCDTLVDISSITSSHISFVTLSPNPAKDRTYLVYYTGHQTANTIELYDYEGRLLLSQNTSGANGEVPIDVKSLADGVYVLRFIVDDSIFSDQKLVVRK